MAVGVTPAVGTDVACVPPGNFVASSYPGGGAAYFSSVDISLLDFSLFSFFTNYDLGDICE